MGHERGTYAAAQHHPCSSWPALITWMEIIPSTFYFHAWHLHCIFLAFLSNVVSISFDIYFFVIVMIVFQTHLLCCDWHSLSHVFVGETRLSHFHSAFAACLLISSSLNLYKIITYLLHAAESFLRS